jgi:hypothetical protein
MSSNPQYECPDDTVCHECGRSLPDEPVEDSYCDDRCRRGSTGVNSLWDLAKHLDVWSQDLGEAILRRVRRRVYKDTDCGASFRTVTDGVAVSGYVEGFDGAMFEHFLRFPFHIDDFFAALDACDKEAEEIWELVREPETADQALRQVVLDPSV